MLTLVEKMFLLSIDDAKGTVADGIYGEFYYGLAGGLLAELVLQGRLAIRDKKIIVTDPTPTGDELLDRALQEVAASKKPHRASHWVSVLPSKNLPGRIAERLVEKNVLRREEKRFIWVIPYQAYQQLDASAKFWLKQHLRAVVLAGEKAEPEDIALLNLIRACNLLKSVFTKDERKWSEKRVEALASEEVFGPAVTEALESIELALVTATLAVATNGSRGSRP
jgi:hypothetical protein